MELLWFVAQSYHSLAVLLAVSTTGMIIISSSCVMMAEVVSEKVMPDALPSA